MAVDENNTLEIKVYPNPTHGILFVETRHATSLPAKTEYCITNLTGQILLQGNIMNATQQIDVSGLTEGMYFIRIRCDGSIITRKTCIGR